MVRFEKKLNRKSAGILKYFEDFLLNFFSKMAILCAALDRKTFAQVLGQVKKNNIAIAMENLPTGLLLSLALRASEQCRRMVKAGTQTSLI